MTVRTILFIVVLFIIMPLCLVASEPVAKQAILIQELRGDEIEIQATGIFTSSEKSKSKIKKDIQKNGETMAIEDAKRSAIHHVLFSGNNPIINNGEDRMRFNSRGAFVYEIANINRYVTFEAPNLSSREEIDGGKTLKISKVVRVNRPQLIRELRNNGVLQTSVFDDSNFE